VNADRFIEDEMVYSQMYHDLACTARLQLSYKNRTGTAIDQKGDPSITCHWIDDAKCIACVEDCN
jgi:hypothetical protein